MSPLRHRTRSLLLSKRWEVRFFNFGQLGGGCKVLMTRQVRVAAAQTKSRTVNICIVISAFCIILLQPQVFLEVVVIIVVGELELHWRDILDKLRLVVRRPWRRTATLRRHLQNVHYVLPCLYFLKIPPEILHLPIVRFQVLLYFRVLPGDLGV